MNKNQENKKEAFWQPWLSTDTVFCRALVGCGYLTAGQMLRAADRYRLGRSRDGGVIFWQIDREGRTRDGKIMYYRGDCHTLYPVYVSPLLEQHATPEQKAAKIDIVDFLFPN